MTKTNINSAVIYCADVLAVYTEGSDVIFSFTDGRRITLTCRNENFAKSVISKYYEDSNRNIFMHIPEMIRSHEDYVSNVPDDRTGR